MPATKPTEAIEQLFGRDLLGQSARQRERLIEAAVGYWRSMGFPFSHLETEQIHTHYNAFRQSNCSPLKDLAHSGSSTVGLRLANSYHPQMWLARSHGHLRSPLEYFNDDTHLAQMLERAPKFWPNRRCWAAQAVRNLCRIYYGGRVANFRPMLARSIYETYSRVGETVIDFSAGYGGRMLAAMSVDRHYVGLDPATAQIRGLLAMRRDLVGLAPGTAELINECAEDALPSITSGSASLVFSSPPFHDLEVYSDESNQSSCRFPEYEDWCKGFLKPVIEQSFRVLRRGGLFAIHVPSDLKSSIRRDAFAFAAARFAFVRRHEVEMRCRPLQRAKAGTSTRQEPIGVFRKR